MEGINGEDEQRQGEEEGKGDGEEANIEVQEGLSN